jgi:NADH dehydrogenase (ubiquinone) 1 alpha subcomplex subunit 5
LIEEVIQVAEGELKLVEVMAKAKVYVQIAALPQDPRTMLMTPFSWEDLEERPAEEQWKYFSRGTDTGKTQTPPQTK